MISPSPYVDVHAGRRKQAQASGGRSLATGEANDRGAAKSAALGVTFSSDGHASDVVESGLDFIIGSVRRACGAASGGAARARGFGTGVFDNWAAASQFSDNPPISLANLQAAKLPGAHSPQAIHGADPCPYTDYTRPAGTPAKRRCALPECNKGHTSLRLFGPIRFRGTLGFGSRSL